MGKKQIGQLQPYELVVIIMIAELAAIPMQNTNIPLINGIIPIFILFAAEITLSYISLKSEKARGVICGRPSILIKNSQIMDDEMRRLRYNINDLLEQLRQKNVTNISEVAFAILETSGQLSVILKSTHRPLQPRDMNIFPPPELLPITLIIDGEVISENLHKLDLSLDWLQGALAKDQISNPKQILFACLDSQGEFFYQIKS
jgi:uncharacterized membrane protein YcaP (DUF421 family)